MTYYSASLGSVAISRFLGVSQLPLHVIPESKKPFLGLWIKWILFFFFVWLFELVNLKVWVDNLGFSAVFVASLPSVSVIYANPQV